jgi:hypothetical protein
VREANGCQEWEAEAQRLNSSFRNPFLSTAGFFLTSGDKASAEILENETLKTWKPAKTSRNNPSWQWRISRNRAATPPRKGSRFEKAGDSPVRALGARAKFRRPHRRIFCDFLRNQDW